MNLITELGQGKYYLYRHIRLDKNEVFYIGIGTKEKKNTYARAKCSTRRNLIWKRIVNKNNENYRIEIVLESNDYNFILQKEIEFIALYGRMDLETGTLSNLTDGGEGNLNWKISEETKRKIGEKAKGRKASNKARENMSKSSWFKNPNYKNSVYQYDLEGNFIKEWNSPAEVKRYYNSSSAFTNNFYSKGINKAHSCYWSYQKSDKIQIPESGKTKESIIRQILSRKETLKKVNPFLEATNITTGEVIRWNSLIEFIEINSSLGFEPKHCTAIVACCKKPNKSYKGYRYKYIPKNDIKSDETNN